MYTFITVEENHEHTSLKTNSRIKPFYLLIK